MPSDGDSGRRSVIDRFKTIAKQVEHHIKVERSRFLGTAVPVISREEALEQYESIRSRYHDATHNCFAYLLDLGRGEDYRYSDDGEPSGTAGRPILDAVRGSGLTNLLVVVTRYFGGVKLGTGGLTRAYRQCAAELLADAPTVDRELVLRATLEFPHDSVSVAMKLLSDLGLKPESIDYSDLVRIHSFVRITKADSLLAEAVNRSGARIAVEIERDDIIVR